MIKKLYIRLTFIGFIVFLNSVCLFAQSEKESTRIRDLMWNMDDEASKQVTVPDKWKDESAVILFEYNRYAYRLERLLQRNRYNEDYYIRRRIKLQDREAVEKFSEFSFQDSGKNFLFFQSDKYFFEIKVIKPDGREQKVDIKESVTEQERTDKWYAEQRKIAIPDLQPGDIIDYYYVSMLNSYDILAEFHSDIDFFLDDKLPTIYRKLEVLPEPNGSLNVRYLNGCPELSYDTENNIFSLAVRDRNKIPDDTWLYPYRSLPLIRFKVTYFQGARLDTYAPLYDSKEQPKTVITRDELKKYLDPLGLNNSIYPYWNKGFEKYLNSNNLKDASPIQKVQEAFYYYRQHWFDSNLEPVLHGWKYEYDPNYRSFIGNMVYFLNEYGLKYDILVTTDRELTDIDHFINYTDLTIFIRVKTEPDFYLIFPSLESTIPDLPSSIQGAKALVLNPYDKQAPLQETMIPSLEVKQNLIQKNYQINFNKENLSKLLIQEKTTYTGVNKEIYNETVLTGYDIVYLNHQKYKTVLMKDKPWRESERNAMLTKAAQKEKEDNEARIKKLEDEIKRDFEIQDVKITDFKLLSAGIYPDSPNLEYQTQIEADGLVKTAGKNYLLEVGKLIGQQVTIAEKDRERIYDIYMSCAREIKTRIEIQIPDGYSIEGLENLSFNIENETGAFQSQAVKNANVVEITINKQYKHNFEKASQWKLMLEFLDAANKFYGQSLLLRKISTE